MTTNPSMVGVAQKQKISKTIENPIKTKKNQSWGGPGWLPQEHPKTSPGLFFLFFLVFLVFGDLFKMMGRQMAWVFIR